MSQDELIQLRNDMTDLIAAVIRLESLVELLRHQMVRLTERLSGIEIDSLTPTPSLTVRQVGKNGER